MSRKSKVFSSTILILFVLLLVSCTTNDTKSHNFEIRASEGGTIPAGQELDLNKAYKAGEKIAIIARENPGYYFSNWTSSNGGKFANENDSQTTFTMPDKDTVVTANFKLLDK